MNSNRSDGRNLARYLCGNINGLKLYLEFPNLKKPDTALQQSHLHTLLNNTRELANRLPDRSTVKGVEERALVWMPLEPEDQNGREID